MRCFSWPNIIIKGGWINIICFQYKHQKKLISNACKLNLACCLGSCLKFKALLVLLLLPSWLDFRWLHNYSFVKKKIKLMILLLSLHLSRKKDLFSSPAVKTGIGFFRLWISVPKVIHFIYVLPSNEVDEAIWKQCFLFSLYVRVSVCVRLCVCVCVCVWVYEFVCVCVRYFTFKRTWLTVKFMGFFT